MPNRKGSYKTTTKVKPKESSSSKSEVSGLEGISPTNVLEILHEDHLLIQDLFFQYTQMNDPKEKKAIVEQILEELYLHATVEEKIVYAQTRENSEEEVIENIMDEADTEHHVAKVIMAELAAMKPTDDHYDAKVTILCEVIKHHVGEEEKEMFKKIKELDLDLDELGEEVLELKEDLKDKYNPGLLGKIWTELKGLKPVGAVK